MTFGFSAVYRDSSFRKFHLDEKTSVRLPGLLNWTYTQNPAGRLTGTIVNTDGIVNCLRPKPGLYTKDNFLVWPSDARSWHSSLLAKDRFSDISIFKWLTKTAPALTQTATQLYHRAVTVHARRVNKILF